MDNKKDGRIEIVVPENSMKEAAESLHDGEILGVLPLRNRVLFTTVLIPITVTRPKSLKLVMEAFDSDKLLAVFCQKDQNVSEPNEADLYRLGVAAKVLRIIPVGEESFFVILQGVERIYLDEITQLDPYLAARISLRPEDLQGVNSAEFTTLASSIKTTTLKLFQNMENIPQDALMGIKTVTYPPMVVNYIAANFPMSIEERQNISQMVLKNTDIITNQFDEMIELSLNENTGEAVNTELTDIQDLLEPIINEFSSHVPQGVTLKAESTLPANFATPVNKKMVSRMVSILLDNAIKNTTEGSIVMKTAADDRQLTIAVKDTGCGVAPEEADHIFERFVKLDNFKEGLGLGLTLCRMIAQRMDGNVTLDTTFSPGARFVITLPLQEQTTED